VKIHVATPEKLTNEMRDVFAKLKELENKTQPKGVFEKAKDMFG